MVFNWEIGEWLYMGSGHDGEVYLIFLLGDSVHGLKLWPGFATGQISRGLLV